MPCQARCPVTGFPVLYDKLDECDMKTLLLGSGVEAGAAVTFSRSQRSVPIGKAQGSSESC